MVYPDEFTRALRSFGQPAFSEVCGCGVRREPGSQAVGQVHTVGYLASMRLHSGDLPVERVGDIDVVVDLGTVHEPDLADPPRIEPLVVGQRRVGEPVAGIRIDRLEGDLTRRSVVRVAATETLPVPLRAPGDDELRASPADSPDQLASQAHARRQVILGQAKELHRLDTQHSSSSFLLGAADRRDLRARRHRVEATGITIGQHDIADLDTRVRPRGDRATGPELGVIRMGDDDEHSFDGLLLGQAHRTIVPEWGELRQARRPSRSPTSTRRSGVQRVPEDANDRRPLCGRRDIVGRHRPDRRSVR